MRLGKATFGALILSAGMLGIGGAAAHDLHGVNALMTGDLDRAEMILTTEQATQPSPEAQLNLAAVYKRTGRLEQARAMYAAVLAQPDVLLDIGAAQPALAHALAQRGLRRLDALSVTAR